MTSKRASIWYRCTFVILITMPRSSTCKRIVKIDGDHLPSLRTLGNILGRTDRYGEAIQPLKRAMSLDPKDNLSANELIYALAIAGDPREAVHLGETYLRDNPRATFMHRQLAFAHLRAAQPKFRHHVLRS